MADPVNDRPRRPARVAFGCALGVLLLAAGGIRQAAADDLVAVYAAFWAGLPAAKIRLKLRDAGPSYHDEIHIETEGLPHLLTKFRATASAEGRLAPDRPAEPSHYRAVYDLRKRRDSRVSMQFVNRNGATIAERGPDDTSRKPPLAEMFRKNAVDPLSAFERIRAALRASRHGGSFTIPVYDGARRFDIIGQVTRKDMSDGMLRAALTLRPIAGFKGETSEDGDPDDAPRKLDLAVTDDDRMVPLSITVPVFFFPLLLQLQRVCAATDPCPG